MTGCSIDNASSAENFPPNCQENGDRTVYFAIAAKDSQQLELSRDVAVQLAKQDLDRGEMVIDRQSSDRLETIYSNKIDRRTLQKLSQNIAIAPTDALGFVAAIDRLNTITKDRPDRLTIAYIITEGTSDPQVIDRLKSAVNNLQDRRCLFVRAIGLNSTHRLPTSEAFHGIRDRIRFASSDAKEWRKSME
jgi:hypothetical protein